VQNKVLEATAAGLPSVVTHAVMNGLPLEVRPACVLADDRESFAEEILRLLGKTPSERQMRAAEANLDALDWSQTLSPLLPILRAAATS
jgi:hypothetical protein